MEMIVVGGSRMNGRGEIGWEGGKVDVAWGR
jgi:hypothetical protein